MIKKLLPVILLTTLVSAQVKAHTKTKRTATGSSHSVSLTCTENTPNTTFNFYRGTVSGQESTTPLNSTPTATCAYTDTNVTALTTYYYTVKAYLSTATPPGLSPASNEVSAVIPGDPAPAAPVLSVGTVAKNDVPLNWTVPSQPGIQVSSFNIFRCQLPKCPKP